MQGDHLQEPLTGRYKTKLKKERGLKCEVCGKTFPKPSFLQIHHVNRCRFDNRLENLQVICDMCHKKIHGFRIYRTPTVW